MRGLDRTILENRFYYELKYYVEIPVRTSSRGGWAGWRGMCSVSCARGGERRVSKRE